MDPHQRADATPALDPCREHDACGVGFVAHASARTTHEVVRLALEAVARVQHRGAASTDRSGDGAGLLTQLPHRFFRRDAYRLGLPLEPACPFAVGMLFLPSEPAARRAARDLVDSVLRADGLGAIGWREVPTDAHALGPTARASQPSIQQVLIGRPARCADDDEWERSLFLARRAIEQRAEAERMHDLYVTSMSARTVVYKALVIGAELARFYPDLQFPEFESALALFHQRYATNTLPSWRLAQPFRLLGHNGEINTLWGNRNAMAMRAPLFRAPVWEGKEGRLEHIITPDGSDSASLDNALELFVHSGRDPVHALMMMMPQAWERYPDVDPAVRAFYEYHQILHEPWDGPAAVAYSDGRIVGAVVDRNGLRPCRYQVRRDGLVVAGSEVGLVDLAPEDVVASGKVGPGEVFLVDLTRQKVIRNTEAKRAVASRHPYESWVRRHMAVLTPDPIRALPAPAGDALVVRQRLFGYGFEDVRLVLEPMAFSGADPVWSMGDDAPIPPLARTPPVLYDYFRQRFAQVTNPPIDSLRESMVMSLRMHLGRRGSPLLDRASAAHMLRVEHPVLLAEEMAGLLNARGFPGEILDAVWDPASGPDGLRPAVEELAQQAAKAVRAGARLLIVSDRAAGPARAPIPLLLALGAVRQHLVHTGLRARVGLVAEAGDAFDIHHLAALFGYGAEAVHPWLALAAVESLSRETPPRQKEAAPSRPDPETAVRAYRAAAEKGLLKILSKMGISTLSSYCGGQIFEALGLGREVIDTAFRGTESPIGGLGFREIGEDVLTRHATAYALSESALLPDFGRVRYRKEGEDHVWSPPVVKALQHAVDTGTGDPALYRAFTTRQSLRPPGSLRDLLTLRDAPPVPIEEVEPVEAIRQRFVSSAMSLGALSPEAHQALTIAMNRLNARSNSGEGGEDPSTYALRDGDRHDSRVKQVASARFGVTTEYLVRAEELEIKIVQGAKPGEGGQLPGHKVTELIARLRHAVPGIPLISPPPHHDIYSIEDLAQLIQDLKTVNPRARVGVKLVATAGVGTVASGVCKAYADYVLIAGHNGGTGASPLSSIKHAGTPWELGLAETQTALMRNRLRHRIEVRVDGGLRTGRDVVIAALLGAESFGFGTAPLIALGCDMARQCHLNSCPTGIATQREDLRAKFTGTPEQVMAYFTLVAAEVRELLAQLGARSLDEIIGRNDLLQAIPRPDAARAYLLDLSRLLAPAAVEGEPPRRTVIRNDRPGLVCLDEEILPDLESALQTGRPFAAHYPIRNHHLTVGARIAGAVAGRTGSTGLPADTVTLRFTGSAGQSFGAFAVRGMRLELEGEANDYVGKGLSGGEITIRPFQRAAYGAATHHHVILGNTALYGATSGLLLAAGQAGDRFAVRNAGAIAVVEGAGNHCCEYMTGGLVTVLGRAGRNFGAGMSNGIAYVLDETGTQHARVNDELVSLEPLEDADEELVLRLLRLHEERTASPRARAMLDSWNEWRSAFRRVAPRGNTALIEATRAAVHRRLLGARVPELARMTA